MLRITTASPVFSKPPAAKYFMMALFASTLLTVTACQKNDANDDNNSSDIEITEITPPDSTVNAENADTVSEDVKITAIESDASLDQPAAIQAEQSTAASAKPQTPVEKIEANAAAAPKQKSNIKAETQVTDVEYRDNSGQSIHVTFQTSAVAALEADLMLPSGKRVLLTAPTGQGNNPTYRSKDGVIELVTHGGGGSMDLIYNGQSTSFDAVSAEAEVVIPQ